MNERIKQLTEQCESFGSWDNKTYSFDKEKFAKLIIEECVDYAFANGDNVDYLKQYFGVEE
jgi:hypothetical protein